MPVIENKDGAAAGTSVTTPQVRKSKFKIRLDCNLFEFNLETPGGNNRRLNG